MTADLRTNIHTSALAFRGYNVTNLGRTRELLQHPAYGETVRRRLNEATTIYADTLGRNADLVGRVEQNDEPTLADYAESIALIMAVEQIQLELLVEYHGVDYRDAEVATGFSLGEIGALVAGGVFSLEAALQIPLHMADDCIKLADDVVMGVVFSKGDAIPMDRVQRVLLEINSEGNGIIGISTILSPNSFLVLGSQQTVARLRERRKDIASQRLQVRPNDHRWPPLHTPIVWERAISDRASSMLHTIPGGFATPHPEILSMVTGRRSYNDLNSRELIAKWIDHPQQLWDVVQELLSLSIDAVIHVGPEPNIIPSTFERLASNVELQTRGSRRMRAMSVVARRTWLQNLLPRTAVLLRAPLVQQVVLEDWLLDTPVPE